MMKGKEKGAMFDMLTNKGQSLGKSVPDAYAFAMEQMKGAGAMDSMKGLTDLLFGKGGKMSPEQAASFMAAKGKAGMAELFAAKGGMGGLFADKGKAAFDMMSQAAASPSVVPGASMPRKMPAPSSSDDHQKSRANRQSEADVSTKKQEVVAPSSKPSVSSSVVVDQKEIANTFANSQQLQRYNPGLGGNPGYVGARWTARESSDYPFVIIRETKDVQSAEIGRFEPGQSCIQAGEMTTLESGVVRMPIKPEGWVSVHARLLNGPTFLDLAAEPSADNERKEHVPSYSRSEFLNYGRILGEQILENDDPLKNVKALKMPELCKDHTAAGKSERREEREARKKERELERERQRELGMMGDEDKEKEGGGKGDNEKGGGKDKGKGTDESRDWNQWRKDGWKNDWNGGGGWGGEWDESKNWKGDWNSGWKNNDWGKGQNWASEDYEGKGDYRPQKGKGDKSGKGKERRDESEDREDGGGKGHDSRGKGVNMSGNKGSKDKASSKEDGKEKGADKARGDKNTVSTASTATKEEKKEEKEKDKEKAP